MRITLLVMTLGASGCWPYISAPYEGTGTDIDRDTDQPVPGDRIAEIRTGVIAPGTSVELRDLDVTAVWGRGCTVQDPRGGDQDAGVALFTESDPALVVGDRIDVTGTVQDYFGELQIQVEGEPVVVGSGLRVTALPLSAAEAAEDRYQGMLVEVSGSVTDRSYDCSVDGPDCSDPGLWEIEGPDGVLVYDRMYEADDWSAHTGDTPVVGSLSWRWSRVRLMPRGPDDFGG